MLNRFDLDPNYLQRLSTNDTSRQRVNDIVSLGPIFFIEGDLSMSFINLNCDFVEVSEVMYLAVSHVKLVVYISLKF